VQRHGQFIVDLKESSDDDDACNAIACMRILSIVVDMHRTIYDDLGTTTCMHRTVSVISIDPSATLINYSKCSLTVGTKAEQN
jgi:hypothetical protein